MSSDVGLTKLALPPVVRSSPAAPASSVNKQDEPRESQAGAARQAEAARESTAPGALDDMVSDLNKLVRELQRELRFSIDEDSGDTVIKVIDKETDEVLRQIPSEELMALRRRLEEAAGVIFRDSA